MSEASWIEGLKGDDNGFYLNRKSGLKIKGRKTAALILVMSAVIFSISLSAQENQLAELVSYLLPNEKRNWFITPLVNINIYGFQPGGGFLFKNKNVFEQGYQAEIYTFIDYTGYQSHYLKFYNKKLFDSVIDTRVGLSYQYSFERFYGFGADTVSYSEDNDDNDESVYKLRQGAAQVLLGYNFPLTIKTEIGFQWKKTHIGDAWLDGRKNAKQIDHLQGVDGGLTNNIVCIVSYNIFQTREQCAREKTTASVKALYDTRISSPEVDSDYTFNKHLFEIKGLLSCPTQRYYSLSRISMDTISGEKTSLPFYEYPALGGLATLRGLSENRYRDRVAVNGGEEVFWRAGGDILISVFSDFGKVFPAVRFVTLNDYQTSLGCSVGSKLFNSFDVALTVAQANKHPGPVYYFNATNIF